MDGQQDQSAGSTASNSGAGLEHQVFGTTTAAGQVAEAQVVPLDGDGATFVNTVAVSPRSRRLRWGAALGIVLAAVLVSVTAAFVMVGSGSGAASLTASLAPKTSLAFLSVRTDLPGDQHQKLADLLHTFPGFADRAQFDNALDDIFNRITEHVSPDLTYTSAIKPWFGGEISVALTNLKPGGTSAASDGDGLVMFSLKDRAKAEAWLDGQLAKSSEKFDSQPYAGTTLHVTTATGAGTSGAYAFTDKALLAGTEAAVKAGLDTKTAGSLADQANYKAAMKSFSGDRLASFYVDLKAIYDLSAGSASSLPLSQDDLTAALKNVSWMAGSVRAESTGLVVDLAVPKGPDAPSLGNAASTLAPQLPGSTVAMFEVHSVGKLVNSSLGQLEGANGTTSTRATAKQIRDSLATIGGLDWLGDASIVLTEKAGELGGGLVIATADAATATTKADMLSNLLTLGLGSSAKVSDVDYKGTTITIADLSGATDPLPLSRTEIAVASHGNLVVAAYGRQFVEDLIDTTASDSLASKASYKAVTGMVGSQNMESAYVDVSALTSAFGQQLWNTAAGQNGLYATDISKYVEHIDAAAMSAVDGNPTMSRIVVTVK